MTHICISKLASIGSDKGLSPGLHQANIWTNAGILLIDPLGTNFSEIVIDIYIRENAYENVVWKMAANLSQPQYVKTACFALLPVLGWQNVALARLGSECYANSEFDTSYVCEKAIDGLAHVASAWATFGVGAGANLMVRNNH